MSNGDFVVLEEAERQFEHLQALKKLDFLTTKNFKSYDEDDGGAESTIASTRSKTKEPIASASAVNHDDLSLGDEYSSAFQNEESTSTDETLVGLRASDVVMRKIGKLETLFRSFEAIKPNEPMSAYEKEPDLKTKEALALAKKIEDKQVKLFSGIYSLKTVVFDLKTNIPMNFTDRNMEELSTKPKLVELYQYSQYDNRNKINLPHETDLDVVLKKVVKSMKNLEKQPHYRAYLIDQLFGEPCKYVIHDTFWWCFLERYQKIASIQEEYFYRVSENYVRLIFTQMDSKYGETFLNSFASLLAISVYTIFCTCFPQSYMTHFGDEFKEFICQLAYLWITGIKPTPRSYSNWNFEVIDPPAAVFAKEVLNNKSESNIINEIEKLGQTQQSPRPNYSRSSYNYSTSDKKSSSVSSSNSRRRHALVPSDLEEVRSNKSSKIAQNFFRPTHEQNKESHTTGRGPEYEPCVLDLFGRSPLVEYYFYNHNGRKINSTETLIQHSNLTKFPPIKGETYQQVIAKSMKNINKTETEYKAFYDRCRRNSKTLKLNRKMNS